MPHFLNRTMHSMPATGLEAARKEILHLFTNVFDIMALILHVEHARLRKGEDAEQLANPPERTRAVDVDEHYLQRVKPLHGSVLDFLVRLDVEGAQARQAFLLRSAAQDLVEALKALKHLQKNLVRYLNSPNPYLRKEYVEMRRRLALLLHALHHLAVDPGENPALTLEQLINAHAYQDGLASGELDRLIREGRIDAETATSLMNDSHYAQAVAQNLLEMASAALVRFEAGRDASEHPLQVEGA